MCSKSLIFDFDYAILRRDNPQKNEKFSMKFVLKTDVA